MIKLKIYFRSFSNQLRLLRMKMISFKQLNYERISYLIFIALCFVGCLYHVIKVTEVYLAFQTKIDISFDTRSQIVVPLVSFCKPKFALMINESHRDIFDSMETPLTPAAIYNSTFGIEDVFLLCVYVDENGLNKFSKQCQLNNQLQINKTINGFTVCYNFKHPQFNQMKYRYKGVIYEFWLYHHHQSEYSLFISPENNFPNGRSPDSLKLIGMQI